MCHIVLTRFMRMALTGNTSLVVTEACKMFVNLQESQHKLTSDMSRASTMHLYSSWNDLKSSPEVGGGSIIVLSSDEDDIWVGGGRVWC